MLMAKLQHIASQAAVAARTNGRSHVVSIEAASYRGAEALRALRTQRKYAAAGEYSAGSSSGSLAMAGRA